MRQLQDQRANGRGDLSAELVVSMRARQVLPWFQPLRDLITGDVVGFEALARWEHPRLGHIAPVAFLRCAQEAELMLDLSHLLLEQASEARAVFDPASDLLLQVNASCIELVAPGWVDRLLEIFGGTGFSPRQLVVEATESVHQFDVGTDRRAAEEALQALDRAGVGIAIDDFDGSDFSREFLERIPATQLKLDRGLLASASASASARSHSRLEAVVRWGKERGLTVLAEGIENHEQLALAREVGCDLGQGYLLGRPAAAVDASVHRDRSWSPR